MLVIRVKLSKRPGRFIVRMHGLPSMTVAKDYGEHFPFAAAAKVYAEKHGLSGNYTEGVLSTDEHVFVQVCTDPLTFAMEIA